MPTSFRAALIAVVIGTAFVVGAFLIHQRRPAALRDQPTAALVSASGKCAE